MSTSQRFSGKSAQPSVHIVLSPRRKRCRNCDQFMGPGKPTKKFCGPKDPGKGECKNEYHRNGGTAFGPLKSRLETLVTKLSREESKKLRDRVDQLERRVQELEEPAPTVISGGPFRNKA